MQIKKFFRSNDKKYLAVLDKGWLKETIFIFGSIFLLILLRPFGLNQEEFLSSAIYWALICVIGFCVFSLTFYVGRKTLTTSHKRNIFTFILLTLIAGLFMTLLVPFFSSIYFEHPLTYFDSILVVTPQMLVICAIIVVITLLRDYIQSQNERLKSHEHRQKMRDHVPEFMKKIPRRLQGEILCLNAEDHYVHVHTDKGRHMLKMRFSDAIKQLEDLKGLRVHRSWWVNENAVIDAQKSGRKSSLLLKNNVCIPVSTSNYRQVKERGLL